jgi:hypothetical protein
MRMLNSIPHFDNVWSKERLQALVVDYEERNRESGMWFLYENERAEQRLPESITRKNLRFFADCAVKKWPLRVSLRRPAG